MNERADQDNDVDDDTLITLLRRLVVESDRFAEIFSEAHGLHRTDMNALAAVMDADLRGTPLSASQVATSLRLSPSATTSALDRLERAGHVYRDRSSEDRRKVTLHIHDRAREVGAAFFTPLREQYVATWAGLTDDDRRTVARFLTASIAATVKVRDQIT